MRFIQILFYFFFLMIWLKIWKKNEEDLKKKKKNTHENISIHVKHFSNSPPSLSFPLSPLSLSVPLCLWFMQVMESNVVVSSTRMPEDSEEVHVLAVDDSLVDRKVIERLLKVLACKGQCFQIKRKYMCVRIYYLFSIFFWVCF